MTGLGLSHRLRAQIANELECMREEIERLGAILCSDPALVERHVSALQALDMLGQQQLALAAILRSENPHDAIGGTPLERLRVRLEQALEHEGAPHGRS